MLWPYQNYSIPELTVKFQTFKAENLVTKSAQKAAYQIKNISDGDNSQFQMLKNLENENTQFNSERVKRVRMIDMKSKLNYFAFHLSNPLIIWIRNLVIKKLVKNEKFINSYLGKIYKD